MKRPLIIFVFGPAATLPGRTPNKVGKKQVEDALLPSWKKKFDLSSRITKQ